MWDPGRLSCLLPSHSWNSVNTVLLQHVGRALCFLRFIQCLLSGCWHLPLGHPYHFSGSSCLYFSTWYFPLCLFLYLASSSCVVFLLTLRAPLDHLSCHGETHFMRPWPVLSSTPVPLFLLILELPLFPPPSSSFWSQCLWPHCFPKSYVFSSW